jgi:hypothetical protein
MLRLVDRGRAVTMARHRVALAWLDGPALACQPRPMRRALVVITVLALAAPAFAEPSPAPSVAQRVVVPSVQTLPAPIAARHARQLAWVRADLKPKIAMAARVLAARLSAPVPPKGKAIDPMTAARETVARAHNFDLASTAEPDIEALVQLVLLQTARDAEEDQRAILEDMKRTRERRAAVRAALATCKGDKACAKRQTPPADMKLADYVALVDTMAAATDAMSELGEMESLRLQMAMDRLSKMMSTLSNLLKKTSETSASIVQNLK